MPPRNISQAPLAQPQRTWRAALPDGDPMRFTADDEAGLSELADRFAYNVVQLAQANREMPDVRLHVYDDPARRARYGSALFDRLENTLRDAIRNRGLNPDTLRLTFDRTPHNTPRTGDPSVEVTVHGSPNRSAQSYQAARKLTMPFVQGGGRMSDAVADRLRWLVQGLVDRVRDNDLPNQQPRLVLHLRSAPTVREQRAQWVTEEVNAAVRAALPEGSGLTPEQFIRDHVEFHQSESTSRPGALGAEILGPLHALDRLRSEDDLAVQWDGAAPASPPRTQSEPVRDDDAESVSSEDSSDSSSSAESSDRDESEAESSVRDDSEAESSDRDDSDDESSDRDDSDAESVSSEESEAHDESPELIPLPAATGAPLRSATVNPNRPDPVVHSWQATLSATDPRRLSPDDQATLSEAVDRIAGNIEQLMRQPAETLDIRLHVADTPVRRREHAAALFEMLEDELRTAVENRGSTRTRCA